MADMTKQEAEQEILAILRREQEQRYAIDQAKANILGCEATIGDLTQRRNHLETLLFNDRLLDELPGDKGIGIGH